MTGEATRSPFWTVLRLPCWRARRACQPVGLVSGEAADVRRFSLDLVRLSLEVSHVAQHLATIDGLSRVVGFAGAIEGFEGALEELKLAVWSERNHGPDRRREFLEDAALLAAHTPAPPSKVEPPRLVPVDMVTGEVVAHECESCQQLQDQLNVAERTIRGHRAKIRELERDRDAEARANGLWPLAMKLFALWQRLTGHTRSLWTADRFWTCEPFLGNKTYGIVTCERGVVGIAYDPVTKPRRNGTVEKFDAWETLFKSSWES